MKKPHSLTLQKVDFKEGLTKTAPFLERMPDFQCNFNPYIKKRDFIKLVVYLAYQLELGTPVLFWAANDPKKLSFATFAVRWKEKLNELPRIIHVATAATAKILTEHAGIDNVISVGHGPSTGDRDIIALLAALGSTPPPSGFIFFTDTTEPHDSFINTLHQLYLNENLPLAENKASAEILLTSICSTFGKSQGRKRV